MHSICELKILWTTLNGKWKWKEKVSGNQLIQHQNWLAKLLAEAICNEGPAVNKCFPHDDHADN